MASLINRIEELDTIPRHQEDEYEYTSDFIEWFYENLCLNKPTDDSSILYRVTQHTQFPMMREHCMKLIDVTYAKTQGDASLISSYKAMKDWLLEIADKYSYDE